MAASSRERQRKHRELQRQAGARIVDYIGVTPEFGENSTLRKLFEF